jgi:hypothetical protein
MRKLSSWFILLVLLLLGPCTFADIADNFMAGGIAFTGSGSFTDDIGNPTSASNQYSHLTITLSPVATFYLLDFFAFSVSPSFSYSSNYTNGGFYEPILSYGLSLGFTWYPYFDPAHVIQTLPDGHLWIDVNSWMLNPNFPLVLAVGFSVGPFLNQYIPGKYSDGTPYDGAFEFNIRLTPSLGVYYFISERYALDIILNPNISIPLYMYGSNSLVASYPINDVQLTFSVSFGITFFVPWIERSQIKK